MSDPVHTLADDVIAVHNKLGDAITRFQLSLSVDSQDARQDHDATHAFHADLLNCLAQLTAASDKVSAREYGLQDVLMLYHVQQINKAPAVS